MAKVSVVMPIYNTKPVHLKQAIESILKQTFTDFEFLILNDSPDNLMLDEIVEKYPDCRIRYFKSKQTRGIGGAYNELLRHVQGEYVAIMNHDDISLPQRLEKQVALLDTCPEIGLVGTGFKT